MSCFRLKSYDQAIPGTYYYEFNYKGQKRTLGPFPIIEDCAKALQDFRVRNGRPRATIQECLQDADHYQCQRLGGMSQYCIPCDLDPSQVVMSKTAPLIAGPCKGCGAQLTV